MLEEKVEADTSMTTVDDSTRVRVDPIVRLSVGEEVWARGKPRETPDIVEALVLSEGFPEFLTLVAYAYVEVAQINSVSGPAHGSNNA